MADTHKQAKPVGNGDRQCARCGEAFTCGMAAGEAHCWCADLPNVAPLGGVTFPGEDQVYTDCLCPTCLRELIASR